MVPSSSDAPLPPDTTELLKALIDTRLERATESFNHMVQQKKSEMSLEKLTRLVKRDVMGRTLDQISADAKVAMNALDSSSLPVVLLYREAIDKVTVQMLAAAPLLYVENLKGKCACVHLGKSWNVCTGHRSTYGLVWREHLPLVHTMLLHKLRAKFGISSDIVVREAAYGTFQWMYTFPGYCYIEVIVVNTTTIYTRTAGEIADSNRVKDTTAVVLNTGDNRLIDINI